VASLIARVWARGARICRLEEHGGRVGSVEHIFPYYFGRCPSTSLVYVLAHVQLVGELSISNLPKILIARVFR